MKRSLLLTGGMVVIAVALVFTMVGFSSCTAGPTTIGSVDLNTQQQGIWVSGEGEITVTPDLATLYLGVESQADTVAEAQSQAAAAMDAVMDALEANGVDEDDIQTQYFSISQASKWDPDTYEEIPTGYVVTNTVEVKIRDIDNVGPIIDAVAAAGGDFIRINNLSFSVDEPSEYYAEVREEAMADAQAKAEQLAELAGVELGAPTYIYEGSVYAPVVYRGLDVAAEASGGGYTTSISPGELDVTLTVQVAYAIED